MIAPLSLAEIGMNVERTKAARLQNRLADYALMDADRQNRERQALAPLLPRLVAGDRSVLPQVAEAAPEQAMNWQQHFAKLDEGTRKRAVEEAGIIGKLMAGVKDEAGYATALQVARDQYGVDVSKAPPYSPQALELIRRAAGEMPSFGAPMEAVDASGNRVFIQTDKAGNIRPMQGYMPPGKLLSDAELAQKMRLAEAGGTKVTVDTPQIGTIPQGYQLVRDGSTMRLEPIPGGPAAQEMAATAEKDRRTREQKEQGAEIVVQDIDRALNLMESSALPTTGIGGSFLSGVPGTAAHDVANLMNSVRSAAAFDRLQAMREASPTGGALGQVTERELALLQAAIGSLEQSQSQQQFADNLRRFRNQMLDTIHGPGNGPARLPLGFQGGKPAPQPGANAGGLDALSDDDLLKTLGLK